MMSFNLGLIIKLLSCIDIGNDVTFDKQLTNYFNKVKKKMYFDLQASDEGDDYSDDEKTRIKDRLRQIIDMSDEDVKGSYFVKALSDYYSL